MVTRFGSRNGYQIWGPIQFPIISGSQAPEMGTKFGARNWNQEFIIFCAKIKIFCTKIGPLEEMGESC